MQCECRKHRCGRCKHTIFSYSSESDGFCGLCIDNYCSCRCPGCLEGAPDQPYGKSKAILVIRPSGFPGASSGRSEGWYPSVPEVDPLEPVVEGQSNVVHETSSPEQKEDEKSLVNMQEVGKRCPTQHKHSKLRGDRCKLARFPSYKAGRIYILQPSGFRAGAAGAEKAEGWPREVPRPNSGVPCARVPSTSTEGGGPHGSLSLLTPRGAVSIPRSPGRVPRWMSGGRATVLWALVVTEVARSLFVNLKKQVESLKGLYGMPSQRDWEGERGSIVNLWEHLSKRPTARSREKHPTGAKRSSQFSIEEPTSSTRK